ncbi:hypothetical protein [Nocardioides cavernaquae]|nr:hypothetical protein [Nocardioides cavernaquae]
MQTDYRLAPQFTARLFGLALMIGGLLLVLVTVLVATLRVSPDLIVVMALVIIVLVFVSGAMVSRGAYVVRLSADGYRVRFVRGAGVKQARWSDVADAVTTEVAGSPCVVLRLKDGRSTTIPVEVMAGDREEFVRELRTHLGRGGTSR